MNFLLQLSMSANEKYFFEGAVCFLLVYVDQ